MIQIFHKIGEYILLMRKVFSIPDRWSMFFRQLISEIYKLGVDSIGIVFLISIFTGAVICLQMALSIESPLLPAYTLGFATRDTLLLEFSSSIMCLILAGKVGSNIASEVGTMRITEQIDAPDIMGVNSANYMILPKAIGLMLFIPVLVIVSMFFGVIGGYIIAFTTDVTTVTKFEIGVQYDFRPFYITYSIIKSVVFAFVISTCASFYGYKVDVKGGALEVGKASTDSVVVSSVMILLLDMLLTKIMLQ